MRMEILNCEYGTLEVNQGLKAVEILNGKKLVRKIR